jgi:hypothetical protein
MLIVRKKFGKRLVNLLMTFNAFNRHFAVLTWGKDYVLRGTKPIGELIKTEITEENILKLKFKYHSSHSVLKEYVAEIDKHNYEDNLLFLNIWSSEQKTELINKNILSLSEQTNIKLKELLDTRVFNEKYGDKYLYFLSLYLNPDIIDAKKDERQFSEITLKYCLRTDNKKSDRRHKSKFHITKNEAQKLCSMISYWGNKKTNA